MKPSTNNKILCKKNYFSVADTGGYSQSRITNILCFMKDCEYIVENELNGKVKVYSKTARRNFFFNKLRFKEFFITMDVFIRKNINMKKKNVKMIAIFMTLNLNLVYQKL